MTKKIREQNKLSKTKQDKIVDVIFIAILIFIAIICIYPIYFVIIASISDPYDIAAGKVLIFPSGFTLSGYKRLLEHKEILLGYRNSLLYLFGGSFLSLTVTLPSAFALSRHKLPGRKQINILFMITMYFGGGLIPTYLLHSSIGWINTPWVMVIPAALSVFHLFLARSSFESIPETIYEATSIDGASDFRFFFQFAIPMAKATVAVLFLFSALNWWNEYIRFMVYVDDPNIQSLQVIIRQITAELSASLTEGMSTGELMELQREKELLKYCVVVVAALPFTILYPFVQRYFNQGVMVGAIKE